jgi:hypothetical protein
MTPLKKLSDPRHYNNLVSEIPCMIDIYVAHLIPFTLKRVPCLGSMKSLQCSEFFTLLIPFVIQILNFFPKLSFVQFISNIRC